MQEASAWTGMSWSFITMFAHERKGSQCLWVDMFAPPPVTAQKAGTKNRSLCYQSGSFWQMVTYQVEGWVRSRMHRQVCCRLLHLFQSEISLHQTGRKHFFFPFVISINMQKEQAMHALNMYDYYWCAIEQQTKLNLTYSCLKYFACSLNIHILHHIKAANRTYYLHGCIRCENTEDNNPELFGSRPWRLL